MAPGDATVVKAKWPNALVPPPGTGDQCLLASVYTTIVFKPRPIAGFPTVLKPRSQIRSGLKITAPAEAKHGEALMLHVIQRNRQGIVVGGITVQLNIK